MAGALDNHHATQVWHPSIQAPRPDLEAMLGFVKMGSSEGCTALGVPSSQPLKRRDSESPFRSVPLSNAPRERCTHEAEEERYPRRTGLLGQAVSSPGY